jgi:hypothetical protein
MTRPARALAVLLALVAGVVAVRAVGCGPGTVPFGQPPMLAITNDTLPIFRDAFNAAADQHRVVLLLSPT